MENLEGMVAAEPRLLVADVQQLLTEVQRLLPDRDPQQFLAHNPTVRAACSSAPATVAQAVWVVYCTTLLRAVAILRP